MEYSAILSTFIRPPFVIKIFVLSIFEEPFYTGFTAVPKSYKQALIQCTSSFGGMSIFEWLFYTGFTVVPKSYELAHNTSSLDGTFISLELFFLVQYTRSYFLCSACHGSIHNEVTLSSHAIQGG